MHSFRLVFRHGASVSPLLRRTTLTTGIGGGTMLYLSVHHRHPTVCDGKVTPPIVAIPPSLQRKMAYEAVGTGLIVLLGCGSVCSVKYLASGMTLGGLSIIWGTTVTLAVYATRDVSGAHLNPAITTALAIHRPEAVSKETAVSYIAAQITGAAAAAGINYTVFHNAIRSLETKEGITRGMHGSASSYAGAFGLTPNLTVLRAPGALAAEILATSVLTYMIFSVSDPDSSVPTAAAPALVGATVTTLVSVFGPVMGAGMNPARDLGPRLITSLAGWKGASLTGKSSHSLSICVLIHNSIDCWMKGCSSLFMDIIATP